MGFSRKPRQSVEVLIEIFENAITPVSPTKLMYLCNLNFVKTRKMTGFLVERGFLERLSPPEGLRGRGHKKDRRIVCLYKITKKGIQLLELVKGSSLAELFEYG